MVKRGEPALATIGREARPFTCHVCDSKVFTAQHVKLFRTIAPLTTPLAASAVSLVCQGCGYVHTFVPGHVQLWPEKDGYPEPA
jgi:hypothetical protein